MCQADLTRSRTIRKALGDEQIRVLRDAILGPVVVFRVAADEEKTVPRANDSEYGLTASVWSRNRRRVAARLHAGAVWPVAGVRWTGRTRDNTGTPSRSDSRAMLSIVVSLAAVHYGRDEARRTHAHRYGVTAVGPAASDSRQWFP